MMASIMQVVKRELNGRLSEAEKMLEDSQREVKGALRELQVSAKLSARHLVYVVMISGNARRPSGPPPKKLVTVAYRSRGSLAGVVRSARAEFKLRYPEVKPTEYIVGAQMPGTGTQIRLPEHLWRKYTK